MDKNTDSSTRAILIPPESWFISQFTSHRAKRKVIFYRPKGDKNPSYIVLNEWREVKILWWIFFLPTTAIALLFFVIILLTAGPVYLYNKEKGNRVAKYFFDILNAIAAQGPYFTKYDFQDYANKLIKQNENPIQRILYVHLSQINHLYRINPEQAINFIDKIWIYNDFFDIANKLYENKFSIQNSIVVDFKIVSKNNFWKETYLKEKNRIRQFEWTSKIDFDSSLKRKPKTTTKKQPTLSNSDKIKLKPNDFLHNDVVLYFEPTYNPIINRHLSIHYDDINDALQKKGMTFYYPARIIESAKENTSNELTAYLRYKYPELVDDSNRLNGNSLTRAIDDIELSTYYSSLSETLGLSELKRPCLIHSVEADNRMSEFREYVYSVYYLSGNSSAELDNEINKYLSIVRIPKNEVFFSLRSPDPNDPDDMFNHQGQEVSQELKEIVNKLKQRNNENILLDSLIFMIKSFKEVQPELCKSLSRVLYDSISQRPSNLSRLMVDSQYRIYLPDYDNLEIVLTPLPKTLYFFFLQNPEGVQLKELYRHREELIKIYSRIGNRTDMDTIRNNINELTDARSNSINEKCSRIKEAFLSKVDDSLAHHYYITGSRGGNKRIILDRSLIEFNTIK